MTQSQHDVWITGIGLVTSHGEGADMHWNLLSGDKAPAPVVDCENYAPYCLHPLPELDWSTQIPRRGDQRQMENWQRLGTFTAGLALEDAGLKEDLDRCSTMDLVVAAGGGERDIEVDNAIMADSIGHNDREKLLLERLTTELRPTLFLAQLSNLLAGNISIVHKVTGSSRTYMGETTAGVTAIENGLRRIQNGQSTHLLVGGSINADRIDMLLLHQLGHFLHKGNGTFKGIHERGADGGGMVLGSSGAFLVMEEAEHAKARGAKAYAKISKLASDLGSRSDPEISQKRITDVITAALDGKSPDQISGVLSGASGVSGITGMEMDAISSVLGNDTPVRAHCTQFGQGMEVNFPLGVAMAALALKNGSFYPAFEDVEASSSGAPEALMVTAVSHTIGEGAALLEKIG